MPRLRDTTRRSTGMAVMSSIFPAAERTFMQPNTSCCVIGDVCRKTRAGKVWMPMSSTGTGSTACFCRLGAVGDVACRQTWRLTFPGRAFCRLSVASDNERAISERAEIRDPAAAAGTTASPTTTGDRDSQPAQALFNQCARDSRMTRPYTRSIMSCRFRVHVCRI